jgi:hypothetical protein
MNINRHILLLIILAFGCQPKSTESNELQEERASLEYEVNLNVRPSFSPNINYKIKKSDSICGINDITYNIKNEDSLLSGYFNELEEIISENFNKQDYQEDHGLWTDGTPATISVALNDSTRVFKFDNSGKNTLLNKFIPPLYNIIHYLNSSPSSNIKMTNDELQAFEQSEETVIDFPIRKVSQQPLTYRLYGRVYYCCYEQVHELFNSFDKEKITYVEVSKFYSINSHDKFYRIFVDDIAKRDNVRWIVNDRNKAELISLGVPEENMISKK